MIIAALISGGKDGLLAAYETSKEHELVCLISIKSKNPESYMFHVPNVDLTLKQAAAMQLPIIFQETEGKKEEELEDLKKALVIAKDEHKIEGVVSGAIFSNYQKERIDRLCEELGLHSLAPLWQRQPASLWKEMLDEGFKVIIAAVAAEGLGEEWLGVEINNDTLATLMNLNKKCYVCTGGEGGEFETFVLDCPLFKKPLRIVSSEKHWDGQAGWLEIKDLRF